MKVTASGALSMKRPITEQKDGLRIMNPPSIPSHLSVFGYEENISG